MTNQKDYPDLGSDVSSVCNFGTRFSLTRDSHSFGGETSGSVAKCWLFSQASAVEHSSNPIQENNETF